MISNSNILFQGVIFQCHVSFREGIITSKYTTSGFQWSLLCVQTFGRWQQQAVLKPCKQQTRLHPHAIQTSWQNSAPQNPPTNSVPLTKYLQKSPSQWLVILYWLKLKFLHYQPIGWGYGGCVFPFLLENMDKIWQNHRRWGVFQNSGTQTIGAFTTSYVQLIFPLVGLPLFWITPMLFKHPGARKARHIEIDLEHKQINEILKRANTWDVKSLRIHDQ